MDKLVFTSPDANGDIDYHFLVVQSTLIFSKAQS